MPLLSIVIPVYNVEKYIHQCLNSVINQNNGKIEIVLVDDGSTDSSGDICDEYAEKHSRLIRVIRQENQGLLLARRTGIKVAQGEYIAHVDADDYLLEGAVKSICDAIDEYQCDMFFFDYIYGNGQGKPERYIQIRDEKEVTVISQKDMIIKQFLFGSNFNNMWMKVVKRTTIDVETDYTSFRSVANGEDVLQSLALIDRSISFVYIPKALYYYRRDNISMSKSYGTKDYDSFKIVQLEMLKTAKKWDLKDNEIICLLSLFIEKNMVIMHQVKRYEGRKAFFLLIKKMSTDEYFLGLKKGLNSPKISMYYKVIYKFICNKHYKLTNAFINIVSVIK